MIFQTSSGLVLFRMNEDVREYLLLHYVSGHWDFPKGKIEQNETKKETALRELKEETDLEAMFYDGFEDVLSYFFKEKGELIKKTVYFYIAQAHPGTIILSHEHQGYEWLPYKDALQRLTFENARKVLQHAHMWLSKQ